ncbi:FadR family transcriptional regulator [Alicyclobacillus fastidiosus]|uniref:FadR family transcriptional regulator n=1 Tax=Alicyclobacillus fastidiosus TaxID=392011 RepID=A0ABY6ZG02_9BACL|nr:FadR/GntR family transcriptional regulator [Alicyclobacillus fastidiosus]WAH41788.1 FadR family transcriptional regulator [Alicyclobacillus fastidiosus]GMA63483.1 transcriptional regulator [Alicyclobacillus fastidiosus]
MAQRESVAKMTAQRIKDFIKSGEIRPDGKLPNERDLSKILMVGRSSVREALHLLETEGVIEIRPTKGSYVLSQENYNASNFVSWYNQYQPEIFHLLETRLALEPMAAFLAAERATDEQLERLEKCHEEFVGFIMENNVLKISLGDEAFHDLIFESSQNPLLQNLNNVIKKMLTDYRKKVFSIPKEAMKAVSQHDEILRFIRERNPEAAKENMIQHLLISKRGLLDAAQSESNQNAPAL